jgi:hypothetical protein
VSAFNKTFQNSKIRCNLKQHKCNNKPMSHEFYLRHIPSCINNIKYMQCQQLSVHIQLTIYSQTERWSWRTYTQNLLLTKWYAHKLNNKALIRPMSPIPSSKVGPFVNCLRSAQQHKVSYQNNAYVSFLPPAELSWHCKFCYPFKNKYKKITYSQNVIL